MRERYDVAIVGGGPAGTATAIGLARIGCSVVVIERTGYEATRVGETMPPAARVPLCRLGVWDRFLGEGHTPSPGILSAWGQEEIYENDFILNPHGDGWHLDRRRFDTMLASVAEEAGACVLRNARVMACEPASGARWRLTVRRGDGEQELLAGLLVEATGRAALATRQRNVRRVSYDRLVAVFGFTTLGGRAAVRDSWTLVEATPGGWWYSALLPDSRVVAAFMTDADLLPHGRERLLQFWQEQLEQTRHTRARLGRELPSCDLRLTAANTYRREPIVGERWLAAGDAATAFDPLSSQGLCHALTSGLSAAQAIEAHAGGDRTALDAYALDAATSFRRYLRARDLYYGREARWPSSEFWRRRQPAVSLDPSQAHPV